MYLSYAKFNMHWSAPTVNNIIVNMLFHMPYSLIYLRDNIFTNLKIPYNENHPRKQSFTNYHLCHSSRENFCDSGNLIYKNLSQDKKCKKIFANASRLVKFTNFFFRGRFPLYGISKNKTVHNCNILYELLETHLST